MSILPGATNTTIHNGVFSATVNNTIRARDDIVSVLLGHSATAGLLDASERFDAPRCNEGTRTSMLRGMKRFVQEGDQASVYWLHGPAGIGKSALAQSLALSLKDAGDHAASFFFSRTAPGRNDGNQLITTLASQLAMNIPPMRPILDEAVKENPFIFGSTNSVKMQSLIVDPLNQMRKIFRRSPWLLARTMVKRKPHPRLILIDGLDECTDPEVQRDLILCIGHAARQLWLPVRFIITSRPESHILATFELDPIFQGPDGVSLTTVNLGDDEDADEQITTFLLKEFAEIRRTHPIRNYLPQPWPLPAQVEQLVAKSSKGFIYPATVIRYIKMTNNRPDECLQRILGLSEIPIRHRPYEPLDILYRHIFESVPDDNKVAIRKIFHFLTIPNLFDNLSGITPRMLEQYFSFKPGHVQHILGDLLCIVTITTCDDAIKILHASLPDFLLEPSRSESLWIDGAVAHAMAAVALYKVYGFATSLRTSILILFVHHLKLSAMTVDLRQVLAQMDPLYEYRCICEVMSDGRWRKLKDKLAVSDSFLSSTTAVIAYLLTLVAKGVDNAQIINHIDIIERYVVERYPLGPAFLAVQTDVIHTILPSLRQCVGADIHETLIDIYENSYSKQDVHPLVTRISKLHMLLMAPFYGPSTDSLARNQPNLCPNWTELQADLADPSLRYPRLAHALLLFLWVADLNPYTKNLLQLAVDLIAVFLAHSEHSGPLINLLEVLILERPSKTDDPNSNPMIKCFPRLQSSIGQYFDRVASSSSESNAKLSVLTADTY